MHLSTMYERLIANKIANFVGRDEELNAVNKFISTDTNTAKTILNIFGIGGVGKSTLIYKYIASYTGSSNPTHFLSIEGAEGLDFISFLQNIRDQVVEPFGGSHKEHNSEHEIKYVEVLRSFDRPRLRRLMEKYFNLSELKEICFDLEIDYENLAHTTKQTLIRDLLLYISRKNMLDQFYQHISAIYPDFITLETSDVNTRTISHFHQFDKILADMRNTQKDVTQLLSRSAKYNEYKNSQASNPFMLDSIGESLTNKYIQEKLSSERLRHYSDAESRLSRALCEGISNLQNQVTIVVDDYHKLSHLDYLIQTLFLKLLPSNCKLILLTRDKLDLVEWGSWIPSILFLRIIPLDEDSELKYLNNIGYSETKIITKIMKKTSGLPLALSLVSHPSQSTDNTLESVNSLAEIMGVYILNEMSSQQRILITKLAYYRRVTQEILDKITHANNIEVFFSDIKQMSIIDRYPDGTFKVHDVVREFITSSEKSSSIDTWKSQHQHACKHYITKMKVLETGDPSWLQNAIEVIHHSCQIDLNEGFKVFMHFVREFESFDHLHPLSSLRSLMAETKKYDFPIKSQQQWILFYQIKIAESYGKWQEADQAYINLLKTDDLHPPLKRELFARVGDLYCNHSLKYTSRVYEAYYEATKKTENKTKIALALKKQGDVLTYQGYWNESISKYLQSLALIENTNQTDNIAWLYLSLAYSYRVKGTWNNAVESLKKSGQLFKQAGNEYGLGIAYRIQGQLQYGIRQYESSYKSYLSAYTIVKKYNDKFNTSRSMFNIAKSLARLGKLSEAQDYITNGLKILDQLDAPFPIAAGNIVRASIYRLLGRMDAALEYAQTGLSMLLEIDSPVYILKAYIELMEIYEAMKVDHKFLEIGQTAIHIGSSMGLHDNLSHVYEALGKNSVNKGDVDDAVIYYKKAIDAALCFNIFILSDVIEDMISRLASSDMKPAIVSEFCSKISSRLTESNVETEQILIDRDIHLAPRYNYDKMLNRINSFLHD